jgi:hypothetical protein
MCVEKESVPLGSGALLNFGCFPRYAISTGNWISGFYREER